MDGFKLVNGDIAIRGDGNVIEVSGRDRLEQELACWMLEPVGTDAMYPSFGSKLSEYIGTAAVHKYLMDVKAEAIRLVNNYVAYQQTQVDRYREGDETTFLNVWQDDDLIASVRSVDVEAVGDTVQVVVTVITANNREVSVAQTI